MHRRSFILAPLAFAVAGCDVPIGQTSQARPVLNRNYDLQGFAFAAQEGLTVSEQENYYPSGDVVWRGDPRGPRIPQVAAMFSEAVDRNKAVFDGNQPINLSTTLVRFHGVTNRTRYSIGGVYNIIFDMTVTDARNGTVIEPPRRIVANLDAPGGQRAVELEESGQTQKVRVTDFLTGVLRQELV